MNIQLCKWSIVLSLVPSRLVGERAVEVILPFTGRPELWARCSAHHPPETWPFGLLSAINSRRGVLEDSLWTSTNLLLLTDSQESSTQHRANTFWVMLRGRLEKTPLRLSVSLCLCIWRCMTMPSLHIHTHKYRISLSWLLGHYARDEMQFTLWSSVIQLPHTQELFYWRVGMWPHNLKNKKLIRSYKRTITATYVGRNGTAVTSRPVTYDCRLNVNRGISKLQKLGRRE